MQDNNKERQFKQSGAGQVLINRHLFNLIAEYLTPEELVNFIVAMRNYNLAETDLEKCRLALEQQQMAEEDSEQATNKFERGNWRKDVSKNGLPFADADHGTNIRPPFCIEPYNLTNNDNKNVDFNALQRLQEYLIGTLNIANVNNTKQQQTNGPTLLLQQELKQNDVNKLQRKNAELDKLKNPENENNNNKGKIGL